MPPKSLSDSRTITNLLDRVSEHLRRLSVSNNTDEVKLNRFHNAFREAYSEIENKGYLDLTFGKFLYSTSQQVEYFAQFVPGQPDVESLLSVFETLGKKFPEKFDIRAYSCGNAVKEGFIFLNEFLAGRAKVIRLHDYNDNVLKVAREVVLGLLASMDGKDHLDEKVRSLYEQYVIAEDTTDIEKYLPKRNKKDKKLFLHLVFGNLFSLVGNPQEVALNLNRTMLKRELAVIELYNRTPEDYNQGKLFQSNKNFLLNYLEKMGIPIDCLRFDVDDKGKERFMEDEDGKYNRAYCFLSKDCTVNGLEFLELKAGTKLVPMRLRRFEEYEVLDLFDKAGFKAIMTKPKSIGEGVSHDTCPVVERRGDKRYFLFKKVKEADLFLQGIKNGIGITAGTLALYFFSNWYLTPIVHKGLWKYASPYQTIVTSASVDVEKNIKELQKILEPSCEGAGALSPNITPQKLHCRPINRDYYAGLEFLTDWGFDTKLMDIQNIEGRLPLFKKYGVVIITGNEQRMVLVEAEAIPRFVSLLEETVRELQRLESSGYKEIYRGGYIIDRLWPQTDVSLKIPGITDVDLKGERIELKIGEEPIGRECDHKESGGSFIIYLNKINVLEARIRYYPDPTVAVNGFYVTKSGVIMSGLINEQGGLNRAPMVSSSTRAQKCVAEFVVKSSPSKSINDERAKRFVDTIYTLKKLHEEH